MMSKKLSEKLNRVLRVEVTTLNCTLEVSWITSNSAHDCLHLVEAIRCLRYFVRFVLRRPTHSNFLSRVEDAFVKLINYIAELVCFEKFLLGNLYFCSDFFIRILIYGLKSVPDDLLSDYHFSIMLS